MGFFDLHAEARGLKLYRYTPGDKLIACETVLFAEGRPAVDMVLRRAQICGRVELEGKIENHFADVYVSEDEWVQTVALDRKSYRALKDRWMRCRVEDDAAGLAALSPTKSKEA